MRRSGRTSPRWLSSVEACVRLLSPRLRPCLRARVDLRIDLLEADVGLALGGGQPARDLEHLGGQVDPQRLSVRRGSAGV